MAYIFRFLLVFLLIYYLIKWVSKLFVSSGSSKRNTYNSTNYQKTPEGETTIKYNPKGEKIIDKDKGEYVEFEEVE
jgi:hypothetical protein